MSRVNMSRTMASAESTMSLQAGSGAGGQYLTYLLGNA